MSKNQFNVWSCITSSKLPLGYVFKEDMDCEEAQSVSMMLKKENEKEWKVLKKTAEQLKRKENKNLIVKKWSEVVGFVMLMPIKDKYGNVLFYEKWSFVVKHDHRRQWIGQFLLQTLLKKYNDKPMLSISSLENTSVVRKYLLSWFSLFIRSQVEEKMNEIIKNTYLWGELYKIYPWNNVFICSSAFLEKTGLSNIGAISLEEVQILEQKKSDNSIEGEREVWLECERILLMSRWVV